MKNENEKFDNDDISRLLGALKQVDPPGDFDVRVRAKIAQGSLSVRRSWFPATASATAGTAVLLVAGYFGYQSAFSPTATQPQDEVVATQQTIVPITAPQVAAEEADKRVPEPAPIAEPAPREVASKPRTGEIRTTASQTPRHPVKPAKTDGGGSLDMASGIAEPLSKMGAETNQSGSVVTVGEVKQNSVAERSGLKPGDVIVGKVNGNTVRVRRDGKIIELKLQH